MSDANGALGNGKPNHPTHAMLRISVIETTEIAATLHLEGQVAGLWTAELSDTCERLLTKHSRLTLDLGDVSLIDRPGLALLTELSRRSVALVCCSPFQEEQLRQAAATHTISTTTTQP
jgi:ABC-type transporter Mla MlaB component